MAPQLLAPARPPILAPSTEAWHEFTRALEPVEFRRGDVLLRLGVPAEELFVIRAGKAKTCCASPDGRELVLDFHCAGELLVEPALFDAAPSVSTTIAVTDVQAGRIARADLARWLALCPEITERLLRAIARRHRESHRMRMDVVQLDASARLAKALLRLAGRFGTDRRGTLLMIEDLTQEELGQYIGARRDTVNKTLSEFARRGWIAIERKTIFLTDPAQLSRRVRVGTPAVPPQR
ncbi:cAMP-binding domain of CRP or a regulatory subunit of cAMP-dependent protein kinases [Lentzea xinjiangensis]|uniref:cAMP-binding domain of CRP or a regulatory subunit of cAMP-dependent protein kinases n=1 Tax=Lentzea xinjiangensis TaxID=402600 RepID=A0A1H9IRC9_9PSEU|nr:Crp/Fnr family transcriptional regulator [Lentzea xinjiangensis]SEQ77077.1 cAMP-binding domain of CRP or a regulatory subunit of cAMP-dependent protein kinases [Lentzea xinjiangensis]